MTRHITINGKTDSISGWARRVGISSEAMRKRVNAGMEGEALLEGKPPYRQPLILSCQEQSRSLKSWAKVTGIPRDKIYNRLLAGWSPEQALGFELGPRQAAGIRRLKPRQEAVERRRKRGVERGFCSMILGRKPTLITINGEARSVSAWFRHSGVSVHTIYYRLNRGLTGEALIAPGYKKLRAGVG